MNWLLEYKQNVWGKQSNLFSVLKWLKFIEKKATSVNYVIAKHNLCRGGLSYWQRINFFQSFEKFSQKQNLLKFCDHHELKIFLLKLRRSQLGEVSNIHKKRTRLTSPSSKQHNLQKITVKSLRPLLDVFYTSQDNLWMSP